MKTMFDNTDIKKLSDAELKEIQEYKLSLLGQAAIDFPIKFSAYNNAKDAYNNHCTYIAGIRKDIEDVAEEITIRRHNRSNNGK